MYILYHFPLCPFSRLVRVMLVEKQVSFKLIIEKSWERSEFLASINPALELPVLIIEGNSISSTYSICEYLEAVYTSNSFFTKNNLINAEIRRLFYWFNSKFYNEITRYLFEEKVVSHYVGGTSPRSNFIRAAKINLSYHMDYIEFLLQNRKWIAGDSLSLADLSAATQLSTLDYLGDISWDKHHLTKEWYAVLKSRPSFRTLLSDRIMGFTPPVHYQNLDF